MKFDESPKLYIIDTFQVIETELTDEGYVWIKDEKYPENGYFLRQENLELGIKKSIAIIQKAKIVDLQEIRLLSEQCGPSPENDRNWILEKIKLRAKTGYRNLDIFDFEDMPGGGTIDRFNDLLEILKTEGFEIIKSNGFSGSFRRISW